MQSEAERALTGAVQAAVRQGKKCIVVCVVGVPSVGKSTLLSNIEHIIAQEKRLEATATRAGLTFSVHAEPVTGRLDYPFKTFLKGGEHAAAAWQMNVLSHYHTVTAELMQRAKEAESAPLPHVAFVERSPRCAINIFALLQSAHMNCREFELVQEYGKFLAAQPVWHDAVYVHVTAAEDAARINRAGYNPEYVTDMAQAHDAEYTYDTLTVQLDRTAVELDDMAYLSVQFFGTVAQAILPHEPPNYSSGSETASFDGGEDDVGPSTSGGVHDAREMMHMDEIFVMEK